MRSSIEFRSSLATHANMVCDALSLFVPPRETLDHHAPTRTVPMRMCECDATPSPRRARLYLSSYDATCVQIYACPPHWVVASFPVACSMCEIHKFSRQKTEHRTLQVTKIEKPLHRVHAKLQFVLVYNKFDTCEISATELSAIKS